jgi:hypothetical protein
VLTDFGYGALRPLGAVLFIVFFVSHVLSKEVALYDEQQKRRFAVVEKPRYRAEAPSSHPMIGSRNPALAKS